MAKCLNLCLIIKKFHFHLENFEKYQAPAKLIVNQNMKMLFDFYKQSIFVHIILSKSKRIFKIITKLPIVAKPKFWFGYFQEFCDKFSGYLL